MQLAIFNFFFFFFARPVDLLDLGSLVRFVCVKTEPGLPKWNLKLDPLTRDGTKDLWQWKHHVLTTGTPVNSQVKFKKKKNIDCLSGVCNSGTKCIGWAKNLFGLFHKMLQKNPNKLFGPPNTQKAKFHSQEVRYISLKVMECRYY